MFAEVRLRTGTGWANYSILRTLKDLSFDTKYLDIGAFSMSLRQEDVDSLGIGDQTVIEIAPNGQTIYNGWFSVDGSSGTKTADDQLWRTVSGKSIVNWLSDCIVYPSSWPLTSITNSDGTITPIINGHSFQNATPGTILRTLIARGKTDRGGLQWLDETSFTGTTTTDSVAWSSTLTVTYSTGQTLLQVLQDLAARRLIQFRMNGMQLQVFNYDSQIVHHTPEQMTFQRGKNVLEHNDNTDSSNAGGTILIEGDTSKLIEYTDSALQTAIGRRRERYVQQGGITDGPTLSFLAQAELGVAGHIKAEETLGVKDDTLPWTNYDIGDWVWADINGTIKNIQIRQISASGADENNLRVGLTLGDLIDAQDIQLQKKIDNITGQGSSGYGALPNTAPVPVAPATPGGPLGWTFTPYRDSNGLDFVQVQLTWSAVTTNVDATVCVDLDHYEIQYQLSGTPWSITANVSAALTTGFFSALPVGGVGFLARVRAVDHDGNASPWLTMASAQNLPKVTTIPKAPGPPSVASFFQTIQVSWNGFDKDGGVYGAEFSRVEVYIGTTSGFTPTSPTAAFNENKAASRTISGLAYSTTYFVKLVMVDKSGNASVASVASAGTTASQLSDPDLPAKLVTGAKIADGTINTAQLTVATFGDSVTPNGSFEDIATLGTDSAGAAHWKIGFPSGTVTATRDTTTFATGTASLKLGIGSGTGTNIVVVNSDLLPTSTGDIWYLRFKAKASRAGVTGVLGRIQLSYDAAHSLALFDANNPWINCIDTGPTGLTTSWQTFEGQMVVPTGLLNPLIFARVTLTSQQTSDNLAVDIYIDDVQFAPVRGSAYIANASIINAKINDLSADKITTGTLQAGTRVIAGVDGANRTEMSADGFSAFDANNSQTFVVSSQDGSVSLAGALNASNISNTTLGSVQMVDSTIQGTDLLIDANGGQVFVYQPTGQTVTTFTTTGTTSWTAPTSVTYPTGTQYTIKVECWGGGGAGQNSGTGTFAAFGAPGGAGGEYAREDFVKVTAGTTYSVVVGIGAVWVSGANPAANGGNSQFAGDDKTVLAHGGGGGWGGFSVAGGTGSTNSIHFSGGANAFNNGSSGGGGGGSAGTSRSGAKGTNASSSGTNPGGAAVTGGAGGGTGGVANTAGTNGGAPGGAGGGAGGGSVHAGGNGGRGQVRLTYGGTVSLVASISAVSGVDSYGNSFPAGINVNGNAMDGAWTAYTPTLKSFTSGLTIATTGASGFYKIIGKTVFVYGTVTASALAAQAVVSLPVAGIRRFLNCGSMVCMGTSVPADQAGIARMLDGSANSLILVGYSGGFRDCASGNNLYWSVTYEIP